MDDLRLLRGRPARLAVLDYGLFRVHGRSGGRNTDGGPRDIGLCGFLLSTDRGEHVLIDGGLPGKYADDAEAATVEDGLGSFGRVLSMTAENRPRAQLARLGVAPEDVTLCVLTHSHIDHLGALGDFAHAPLLLSAAERALPRPLYWTGGQPWDWPDRPTVTTATDARVGPGLTLLQAPGHAPGQVAFALDLPRTGPVLLTSDAVSRPAEIAERFNTAWRPAVAMRSAGRVMGWARATGAFVVYGHDPAQWGDLRKAPSFYD